MMTRQFQTWKFIERSLAQKIPVAVLYVLESRGSSPGRQGFFMAVNAKGEMEGSIGGGMMEHKFVELARKRLTGQDAGEWKGDWEIRKQFHDKEAPTDQSGMICSGEQTILVQLLRGDEHSTVEKILGSLERHQNGTLILSPGEIGFIDTPPPENHRFDFRSESDWSFKEKTGYKNWLSIIGGGHCCLALSKLMRSLDFYIRVYDDRAGLKTILENQWAHEKHVVGGYGDLERMIEPGSDHYVVIMTFGYRTDEMALRALLDKDFWYIGLLGSSHKIEKMLDNFRREGVPGERLQRIHTPIGLSIKSETPEEIAVSIAAEIINIKNRLP